MFKCKSIIEIEKELRKGKQEKKRTTNRDKRVRQPRGAGSTFCPGCQTRDKRTPLLSRPGIPGWETGITKVSQPGQISFSVVVFTTLDTNQITYQT